MKPELKKLNRFTTIPFLIDLLKREKLALINPSIWEDYNDRATMEVYRNKSKAQSIYALCLTHQNETIHHWNAFANGTAGCCIEFSPEKLFKTLDKLEGVHHGKVQYKRIQDLPTLNSTLDDLPYLKRFPFKPENEYRLIAVSDEPQQATFDIDIDLSIIRKVTISNKVPEVVFKSLKESLMAINPKYKGRIYHSTLFNNVTWVNHFNK
ncbi:hypothetical protein C3K47_15425 [Solitalea longa]|uniref:DUF2971 domain-containing protein n=1 Tax=Solitalea longa TaxID=2079460 RepID=A0A2S4ZZG0_9SPHI|nr:hypothetical protein [Solitalea longa]POY35449.1 hypothetical protein C3K47_15425 [Solitalea longa]